MAGGSAREREEQDCSQGNTRPKPHHSSTQLLLLLLGVGLPAPVRHRARTHRLCSVGVSKRGIMCIFRAAFKQGVERVGFFNESCEWNRLKSNGHGHNCDN